MPQASASDEVVPRHDRVRYRLAFDAVNAARTLQSKQCLYQPIENYGVIGNMRTAALVGMNGSIDWYCFPAFDSPSVFAAILDDKKGGSFSIAPATEHTAKKQFYWPDTNVLVTRFFSPDGVGQITDFMPVGVRKGDPGYEWLIRRVSVARGSMRFKAVCRPAFDYARAAHEIERRRLRALPEQDLTLERQRGPDPPRRGR